MNGVVVALNNKLSEMPSLANQMPYSGGWLAVVKPTRLARDLRNLLFGNEAQAWIDSEAQRLDDMLQADREYRLAATGPRALEDIYGSVDGLHWDELTREFLLNQPEQHHLLVW